MIIKNIHNKSIIAIISLVMLSASTINENQEQELEFTGEQLSKMFCAMCHKYPDPSLLDKKSWENYMLPRMGYFLGVTPRDSTVDFLIEQGPGGEIVKNKNIFPDSSLLEKEDWDKIFDYYMKNSPDSLIVTTKTYTSNLSQFEVIIPGFRQSPPTTTLMKFAPDGGVYYGDANKEVLYHLNKQFDADKAAKLKEGIVWLNEKNKDLFVTVMGSFSPTDNPLGLLIKFDMQNGGTPIIVIDSLQRPVHTDLGDLNNDGKQDAAICEFAKWTGGLSWWENIGNNEYTRHSLRNDPGATKAYIRDFNNDSLNDIIALFAQGNEAIYIYYNQGDGTFLEKQILQFDASWGSSYFNLFDYENDGDLDIIYTAGDNADFEPILKPYHGIYIFRNDGNNNFDQAFFQQLNGAYSAIPNDFDGDGDLDIAAISFFPDYLNNPNEGFVYYENTGNMQMKAYTFKNIDYGRWIVMDSDDFDNDGDLDLAIGSLMFEITPSSESHYMSKWINNGVPFIVLKNNRY